MTQTPIRLSALLAVLALAQGCAREQKDAFYDPWQEYELGKVYDCGDIQQPDMRHNTQNAATPGFGCSHQSNMAVMIADPSDLVRPRAMTPSDPQARQRVLEAYRTGDSTATAPDARGTTDLIQ